MTLFVFQSESLFGPKLLNPHCDQCNRSNKIYQITQNLLENNGSIAVIDRVLGLGLAEEWQFFKTSASDKHFIPRPRLISIWSTSASANLGGKPRTTEEEFYLIVAGDFLKYASAHTIQLTLITE